MMRLGIVGAGSIIPSHLQAAKLNDFVPVAICGKENSERAMNLSKENPELKFKKNLDSLLEVELDALLIATTPDATIPLIKKCLIKSIPILVEKPVGISLEDFSSLDEIVYSEIMVAFNRRFYSSVEEFKSILQNSEAGLIQINIPELSWIKSPSEEQQKKMLFENSVHMFDLVNYLFEEVSISEVARLDSRAKSNYQIANIRTRNGSIGTISLGFGAPDNLSVKVWTNGEVLELLPIEKFSRFTELVIEKQTDPKNIKIYKKKDTSDWRISEFDVVAKPGFMKQYSAFANKVRGYSADKTAANIWDAIRAIEMANSFCGNALIQSNTSNDLFKRFPGLD
jgi:predicted dehydrogenase